MNELRIARTYGGLELDSFILSHQTPLFFLRADVISDSQKDNQA